MVATIYEDIDWDDPAYSKISHKAKIHPTARLEPFSIIEEGVSIGENTLIGPHNHLRPDTEIGKNCLIGGHNIFEGKCKVGDFVRIGTHCNITWYAEVGDYVDITGHFTGGNDKRILWHRSDIPVLGAYKILRGARIGLGVVLNPGVTVGEEAFIGAGSLVTRSVPAFELWYGVPAKKRGDVPQSERLRV